jgi:hypothetical protein
MSRLFDIGLMLFLLIILYRITLLNKERKRLKAALEQKPGDEGAGKYRFFLLFQLSMYVLWGLIFFYYVYFFLMG